MKKTFLPCLLVLFLLLCSCGNTNTAAPSPEPDQTESEALSEASSETASESLPDEDSSSESEEAPVTSEEEPVSEEGQTEEASSNWEGADGFYYRDGYEYTLEVTFGGTAEQRTYSLIIRDQEETVVLSLDDLDTVNSNDLRAEKDGTSYLFRYSANGGNPMITVENENGVADFQGDYFLVQG